MPAISAGDFGLRTVKAGPPVTSATVSASTELEIDVAYLLNQAKADRNEQVALTRSAGGSLRVEGVVESQQRKDEFLQALAPVSNNPAVKIEIRTVSEAMRHPLQRGSVVVEETEETANTVAADQDLRARQGGGCDARLRAARHRMGDACVRGHRAERVQDHHLLPPGVTWAVPRIVVEWRQLVAVIPFDLAHQDAVGPPAVAASFSMPVISTRRPTCCAA